MSKNKPSLPKGTRDFSPEQMGKRNFIINHIKNVFEIYGFAPLETPALENLSVLTNKYGEEGDQLLFKVLNSGNFLNEVKEEDIQKGYKHLTNQISEKGLRYDLTVPLARFVVMNQHEITFPFRRYQIQPVWRADRPQKSRYREFYQCDADVIGTNSLICEAEILLMIHDAFKRLGLKNFVVKINNRKILKGIAEIIGQPEKENELCVAIDKLDKIGMDKVKEELIQKDFTKESLEKLESILFIEGNYVEKIKILKEKLQKSVIGQQGIQELEEVFSYIKSSSENQKIEIDLTLARGLSYYTGTIFEIKAIDVKIGSIGGGGRYDNLTGVFGLEGVSGVGISFGIDRIYDVMEELTLFPTENFSTQVLIISFDETTIKNSIELIQILRDAKIKAEIYPESAKLKKQLSYANSKKIPFVILIGEEEIKSKKYTLKNMESGEQKLVATDEIISFLKNH